MKSRLTLCAVMALLLATGLTEAREERDSGGGGRGRGGWMRGPVTVSAGGEGRGAQIIEVGENGIGQVVRGGARGEMMNDPAYLEQVRGKYEEGIRQTDERIGQLREKLGSASTDEEKKNITQQIESLEKSSESMKEELKKVQEALKPAFTVLYIKEGEKKLVQVLDKEEKEIFRGEYKQSVLERQGRVDRTPALAIEIDGKVAFESPREAAGKMGVYEYKLAVGDTGPCVDIVTKKTTDGRAPDDKVKILVDSSDAVYQVKIEPENVYGNQFGFGGGNPGDWVKNMQQHNEKLQKDIEELDEEKLKKRYDEEIERTEKMLERMKEHENRQADGGGADGGKDNPNRDRMREHRKRWLDGMEKRMDDLRQRRDNISQETVEKEREKMRENLKRMQEWTSQHQNRQEMQKALGEDGMSESEKRMAEIRKRYEEQHTKSQIQRDKSNFLVKVLKEDGKNTYKVYNKNAEVVKEGTYQGTIVAREFEIDKTPVVVVYADGKLDFESLKDAATRLKDETYRLKSDDKSGRFSINLKDLAAQAGKTESVTTLINDKDNSARLQVKTRVLGKGETVETTPATPAPAAPVEKKNDDGRVLID